MGIMTVCANGSILISGCQSPLVDTIQCFLKLIEMTLLARAIKLQRKITRAAGGDLRVGEPCDIGMAIYTGNVFRGMDRGSKFRRINRNGMGLSPDLSSHSFLLVTG
jgi:hypothetical protein